VDAPSVGFPFVTRMRSRPAPKTRTRARTQRRWRRVVAATAGMLIAAWIAACYAIIARPTVDHPTSADAIVVLGSPIAEDRLGTARGLVDRDVSTNLVLSLFPDEQPVTYKRYCQNGQPGITVVCFRPNPATTRGEAQYVRTLAAQHQWHRIVVVTSTYHVSRARLLFERCFSGQLQLVGTSRGMSLGKWAYQYAYQTGAYLKAETESGC
jgi:uncharacterized SAM-binding protein YcdF (DUF218 family)